MSPGLTEARNPPEEPGFLSRDPVQTGEKAVLGEVALVSQLDGTHGIPI